MSINICSKLLDLRSKDLVTMDLPDTSFNTPVAVLRQLITNRLNLENEVDLIAFGKILKDDKSLACYGIKGTTTIYVFKKRDVSHITCMTTEAIEAAKVDSPKPEASQIKPMVSALKHALRSPEFRATLAKLNNREEREKLIAFTPGLREDPIVLAILQDPDLISLCTEDTTNFAHVVERHPVFAVAVENLAATFHEEHPDSHFGSIADQPMRYGLDDSDEEDEEEGAAAAPAQQPASADVISAMLRQALENANNALGTSRPLRQAGSSSTGVRSGEPTSRSVTDGSHLQRYVNPQTRSTTQPRIAGSVITSAMLQQALSTVSSPQEPSSQPTVAAPVPRPILGVRPGVSPVRNPTRPIRNWSNELARLRELGITDETYSIQVLEATDGDVEAAVNIILGSNQ